LWCRQAYTRRRPQRAYKLHIVDDAVAEEGLPAALDEIAAADTTRRLRQLQTRNVFWSARIETDRDNAQKLWHKMTAAPMFLRPPRTLGKTTVKRTVRCFWTFKPLSSANAVYAVDRLPENCSAVDPIPRYVLKLAAHMVARFIAALLKTAMAYQVH
jgi:hypothetical protein